MAILHIDADCFFVSCELAKWPKLKGKPVATGMERGIVSALSYEAKYKGVKRGMSIFEAKKVCKDIIFIPSDYETYSLYSKRMYNIVRRYSPQIEEYSIDECFADLKGLDKLYNKSLIEIAKEIKETLDRELGFNFSLGLAPTKTLAKIASKWNKPSGLTIIEKDKINNYLKDLEVIDVWGIGPQTAFRLKQIGIKTAYEYVSKSYDFIKIRLHKPQYEIWQELQGNVVYKLNTNLKDNFYSISKTKTFTPAINNYDYVFSQLSKNVENACIKLRRYNLAVKSIFFFLKTQNFNYQSYEIKLVRASNNPIEIIKEIDKKFSNIYSPYRMYRASGVVFSKLTKNNLCQTDIFLESLKNDKLERIFSGLDKVSKKYGKHSIFLGSSFQAIVSNPNTIKTHRDVKAKREAFRGERARKRIGIPYLGKVN
jgi:DNA polymerase-4/DNA polymerase V